MDVLEVFFWLHGIFAPFLRMKGDGFDRCCNTKQYFGNKVGGEMSQGLGAVAGIV